MAARRANPAAARYAAVQERLDRSEALLSDFDQRITRALEVATDSIQAWRGVAHKLAAIDEPRAAPVEPEPAATVAVGPAPELTADLGGWVRWLVSAYDLTESWPTCWHRHPGLVANVCGLRRWHVALTAELATDPTAVSSWHDTLHRLNEHWVRHVASRCLARHQEAPLLRGRISAATSDHAAR